MPTLACHTLGCKVNQYDTEAMKELLCADGYSIVSINDPADVYLLNTCTVTGTGDRKSMQLARRLKRLHPGSKLILCGCMAQLQGEKLLSVGADLVLGTQHRTQVAALLRQVIENGTPLCAVEKLPENMPFERLQVTSHQEHTRAVLKIQEGCRNRCSYCIIPEVRGPVRSRPLDDIRAEAERLAHVGFREIVLTGIHISSYGLDFTPASSLLDVIHILEETKGIIRIRLGSLEPGIATAAFSEALHGCRKVCPQFHLALQSGSDSVLKRMRRRYLSGTYLEAVDHLRSFFPDAAFTTDILTGFPGETEEEFEATKSMIRQVGFARIHVFPYSPRPGTPAAAMEGQLSETVKQQRAKKLIALGNETALCYNRRWIGRVVEVLPEEKTDGCWEGYTPEYLRVRLNPEAECCSGVPVSVLLKSFSPRYLGGVMI